MRQPTLFYLPYISENADLNWLTKVVAELQRAKYNFKSVVLFDVSEEIVIDWKWLLMGGWWRDWAKLTRTWATHFIKVNVLPLQRLGFIQELNELLFLEVCKVSRWWVGLGAEFSVMVSARFDDRFQAFIKVFKPRLVVADVSDYRSLSDLKIARKHADVAITNSIPLYEKVSRIMPAELISAGYFSLSQLRQQRRNVKFDPKSVVFIGSVDWRMDFDLVLKIMKALPRKNFNFYYFTQYDLPASQCSNEEWRLNKLAKKKWQIITQQPNFQGWEVRTQDDLSTVKVTGSVGILPYTLDSKFNQYCHPIKFYNYLNYGLKVVSMPLKSIAQYQSKSIIFAHNAQEFVTALSGFKQPYSTQDQKYYWHIAEQQCLEKKAVDIEKVIKKYLSQ